MASGQVLETDETNNVKDLNLTLSDIATGNPASSDGGVHWLPLEKKGGFEVAYSVNNVDLPADTTIAAYWSTTKDLTGEIGTTPAAVHKIAADDRKVSLAPRTIDFIHDDFIGNQATPPSTAKFLVIVADPPDAAHPHGLIVEVDEGNNVTALRLVPLVVNVVTHGFNPGDAWDEFRAPWKALATQLDDAPPGVLDPPGPREDLCLAVGVGAGFLPRLRRPPPGPDRRRGGLGL